MGRMGRKVKNARWLAAVITAATCATVAVSAQDLGVLAPANLTKARSKAPIDITGTWFVDLGFPGSWRFGPPYPKLTPEAQKHFDAARKAQAEGKVYRDDIGQCWPAGVPLIMTRVWSISMVQLPTVVYMISGFMNSLRVINLDGRPHTDPDLIVRTFNGDSIGRFEGDTLIVDVTNFNDDTWLGSDGYFHTDKMHVVERLTRKGDILTYAVTVDDPLVLAKPWALTPRDLKLSTNKADALLEAPPCVEHDAPHIVTLDHH